jgi:hypothetical protein
MKRRRARYLKQKPVLYFDENVPTQVIEHFRKTSRWRKKVKVLSAVDVGNKGQSDEFHFQYCSQRECTLVSFDAISMTIGTSLSPMDRCTA